MISAFCVDNFYENQDSVRDFALGLDFKPARSIENYPGFRTRCLSRIDNDIFKFSVERFLLSFFDLKSIPEWSGSTHFQKIYTFNSDRHHPMNEGWAHRDDKGTLAGVVYLNKNTCLDSGTKILSPKKEYENHTLSNEDILIRRSLYHKHYFGNKDVDQNLYSKAIENHNSKFDTTIEFKNVYNRLIAYNGELWHKQSCFWVPEEFRLTQVFFINFLHDDHSLRKIFSNNFPNKLQYS